MRRMLLPPEETYWDAVGELWKSGAVQSMAAFPQHGGVDCLRHCLAVSYLSWRCCRRLGPWMPGPLPGAGCCTICSCMTGTPGALAGESGSTASPIRPLRWPMPGG